MNDEDLTRGISRAVADGIAAQAEARRPEGPATSRAQCNTTTAGRDGRLAVFAVVVAGLLGYTVGQRSEPTVESLRVSDGVPGAATGAPIDPEDSALATATIVKAFHDAYDGGSPHEQRNAAVQDGKRLEPLRAEAIELAVQRGFLAEQLAQESIEVHDVSLVDRTHTIVRFTISIPPAVRCSSTRSVTPSRKTDGGRSRCAPSATCCRSGDSASRVRRPDRQDDSWTTASIAATTSAITDLSRTSDSRRTHIRTKRK